MFSIVHNPQTATWSLGQSRTCSVALDTAEAEQSLECWREGDFTNDPLAELLTVEMNLDEVEVNDLNWVRLMKKVWVSQRRIQDTKTASRATMLARRSFLLQYRALELPVPRLAETSLILSESENDPRIQNLIQLTIQFRVLKERAILARNVMKFAKSPQEAAQFAEKSATFEIYPWNLTVYLTCTAVIMKYGDHVEVMTHNHLLTACDKIDAHLSMALFIPWWRATYMSAKDTEILNNLIELLHATHIKHGQAYFDCAKMLDGILQAVYLMHPDVDGPTNVLMYQTLKRKCEDSAVLSNFFSGVTETMRGASPACLIEASAMGKLSGHPSIDVDGGLAQLKERVMNEREADPEIIARSVRMIKKFYVKQYIIKNRKWPPLVPGASPNVMTLLATDAVPDGPQAAHLNIVLGPADWDSIILAPDMKYRSLTSIIPYIKDRTISLDVDQTLSSYEHQDFDILYKEVDPMDAAEIYKKTSLVLFVMLTKDLSADYLRFFEGVMRATDDDFHAVASYLIIKLTAKEGELKRKARLFGMKTFSYRLYSMLQELTAADMLMSCYPSDQAMTAGELDLKHRYFSIANMVAPSPDYVMVQMVIDASGWNNGFRKETVGPIGKVIDQVTGVSVFEKTHQLYENSLIVNMTTDKYVQGWEGQKGGIEGLNQDTWVSVYLSQMHAIFSELNFPYHFLVRGDNFLARVAVPRDAVAQAGSPAVYAMELTRQVTEQMRRVGHDAKPEESTCSLNSVAFCHTYAVRGIQIPDHMRKLSKMSGTGDAFLPTLDSMVSALFANAHACAERGVLPFACYHVALVWMYTHMLSSKWNIAGGRRRRKSYATLLDDALVALSLMPNVVGGFPLILLENMMIRSEADHLPQFIALYQKIKVFDPLVASYLRPALEQARDPQADLLTLMVDPRALALNKPPGAESILTRELDGRLQKMVKNEELVALYSVYNEESLRRLVDSLQDVAEWPAKIIANLYESSAFASRDAIAATFHSCKTAIAFLLRTPPSRTATPTLVRRMMESAHAVERWRVNLIHGSHARTFPLYDGCPTEGAQRMRDYHWQRSVRMITTPPMGHSFRLTRDRLMDPNSTYIRITVSDIIKTVSAESDHLIHGRFGVFVGHETSSATRGKTEVKRARDQLADSVLSQCLMRSWCRDHDADGSLVRVVDYLISSFTDLDPASMIRLSGEKASGTADHHLRSKGFNPTIAPNTTPDLTTMYEHDTRNAVAFQRGAKYPINFLQEILYFKYLLHAELQSTKRLSVTSSTWILELRTCECFKPIAKTTMRVANPDSLKCLRSSVLPAETRARLTDELACAVEAAGSVGAMSPIEPTSAQAANGLLLSYWSELTRTIEAASFHSHNDAYTWDELCRREGIHVPKTVSLNVLRRMPPADLVRSLSLMNAHALMTEPRRGAEIVPSSPSIHVPSTSALIYITAILNEGAMLQGLYAAIGQIRPYLHHTTNPLYQQVWHLVFPPQPVGHHEVIWLCADLDYHEWLRVVRLFVVAALNYAAFTKGHLNHGAMRAAYAQFEADGKLVCDLVTWGAWMGIVAVVSPGTLTIHRSPTGALNERAREGAVHYDPRIRNLPTGVRPEFTRLHGFDLSLEFRASLRVVGAQGGEWDLPPSVPGAGAIWRTTTQSPSRLICLFTQLGIRFISGMKVACVGDGMGGNSHFLSCMGPILTIFYSTLYRGAANEQAPGALAGFRGQIREDYMQCNLRDVTNPIWREAFAQRPELVPDLLLCDAELEGYEQHLKAVDALMSTMEDHRAMMVMLRVKGLPANTVTDLTGQAAAYAEQVSWFPVSGSDAFIVARYGRTFDGYVYAGEPSQEIMRQTLAHRGLCSLRSMMDWCERHALPEYPLQTLCKSMDITTETVRQRLAGTRFVAAEQDRLLRIEPIDLGLASRLSPILVALGRDEDRVRRLRDLLTEDWSSLMETVADIRAFLVQLAARNLLSRPRRLPSAQEEVLEYE